MVDIISSTYRNLTAKVLIQSFITNLFINTVIAAILHAIGFGRGFVPTLIFSQCIGMSIYGVSMAATRLIPYTRTAFQQLALIIVSVVIGAVAGSILGAVANGFHPLDLFREYSAFFYQIVLLGMVFGAIVSYIFISTGRLSEEKAKRLEAEKNVVQNELKLLQSQLEPHYLFNTLSNVLSLIDTDKDRARSMLESFTRFLRASFLTARKETVTLAQELDVVENYLRVFEVRMGDRLRFSIDLPQELREVTIPPLMIQPLVENAIKHGLEPSREGGEIHIIATRDGSRIRITVIDTGQGIDPNNSGTGIGLDTIRKRLELVYPGQGRLFLEENRPKGTRVVIELPYENDPGDHSGR